MTKRILGVFAFVLFGYSFMRAQSTVQVWDTISKTSLMVARLSFPTQSVSFFCKKELQLQKLTKLNVYLRLGTKDWADYLERKPNATTKF
ncbi:MAG: hypothetical protein ICV65_17255 [Flavisolibacter sp.]|nr:hypothetical protein [Flavisolibacter sp.]